MDRSARPSAWEDDKVVLRCRPPRIRVLAEGQHDLPARLYQIPEANQVPSRHVEVRPAITMIPQKSETLPPATHTNAVVIGDGEVLIVDPGSADPEELAALYRVVDGALLPGRKPLAIALTHRHRDHLAGVEAVRARYGIPVWAHALVRDRARVDRELHEGDFIELDGRHPRRLRVLETPGHRVAPRLLVETSKTLVAGDLVSPGTVIVDPPEGNMRTTSRRSSGFGPWRSGRSFRDTAPIGRPSAGMLLGTGGYGRTRDPRPEGAARRERSRAPGLRRHPDAAPGPALRTPGTSEKDEDGPRAPATVC
jgi:hypothetical protein